MAYQREFFPPTPIEAAACKPAEEQGVFGELVSVYTRAQAIEDGILVDLCDPESDTTGMVAEAGWKIPVAMTATAFNRYVWPIDYPEAADWLTKRCQDMRGRLWDVLWMSARFLPRDRSEGSFRLHVVTCIEGERRGRRLVTLKAVLSGGDDGEPCLTIMLPEED